MPNGNWVPLPPFAQQFLTHLLMNKRISSSYSLKNLNWPEPKGKLFDGCELEARVSEKNEEIHHRTNFIFGTSWNEKTWDNNMLNLIQVLVHIRWKSTFSQCPQKMRQNSILKTSFVKLLLIRINFQMYFDFGHLSIFKSWIFSPIFLKWRQKGNWH